ncbi:MAG: threonine-phosphate decarboxylase CobD [Bacillota bacterium]|jgi:threonine-phosphate decarboxylase|nr:threonine-phosphate decarboxylase CobD [Bacillota bacterium]NMB98596.1 threonine-phosphate decarboxylase [Clostridiaceae bacterium]
MEIHGADIYTASEISGYNEDDIMDFSSNINPLGIPETVISAAVNSIKYTDRYPDINSRKLIDAISEFEETPKEFIFVSNGAGEAIFRIAACLRPQIGLITAPSFSEYEKSMKLFGADINYYPLQEKNSFKIKEDILNYINEKTKIVFICNPNNPTGQLTDKNILEKIILKLKEEKAFLAVDECFLDFVENSEEYSTVDLINKYDNLIVIKAFTKTFAIPGIRLGYCMSLNEELINNLKSMGPPWNVSTIAQAAGIAALKEKEYIKRTAVYVKEQRNYLFHELKKTGIKAYESHANYILFKTDIPDLKEEMLKRQILIRSCSDYMNLSKDYYRIAVRTKEENKIFIEKLKEIMR